MESVLGAQIRSSEAASYDIAGQKLPVPWLVDLTHRARPIFGQGTSAPEWPKVRTRPHAPHPARLCGLSDSACPWRRTNNFEAPRGAPSAHIDRIPPSRRIRCTSLPATRSIRADEACTNAVRGCIDLRRVCRPLNAALGPSPPAGCDFDRFSGFVGAKIESRGFRGNETQPLPAFPAHLGVDAPNGLVEQQACRFDRQFARASACGWALAAANCWASVSIESRRVCARSSNSLTRARIWLRPAKPRAAAPEGRMRRFEHRHVAESARSAEH